MNLEPFSVYQRVELNRSPLTIKGYFADLARFDAWCRERPVTRELVREYLGSKEWSAASRCRVVSALRSYYEWAVDNGHETADPTHGMRMPKIPERLPVYPSADQMNAFLSLEPRRGCRESARDTAIAHLLAVLGLRRGEIVGLNVGDVNEAEWKLRVVGKGNRERQLPLFDETKKVVAAWLAERDSHKPIDEALFVTGTGARISNSTVHEVATRRSSIAFGRPMSPHKFRHGAFTRMCAQGHDLLTIKEVAGHKNIQTTTIYTHCAGKKIEDAVRGNAPK